jgi:hypothetical protein
VPLATIRHQTGHSFIAAQETGMSIIAWIALGLGAGLLARRDSRRSYDSERPVLVRAGKRLYQDPGRQPLVDERHACLGRPPL